VSGFKSTGCLRGYAFGARQNLGHTNTDIRHTITHTHTEAAVKKPTMGF